MFSEEYDRFRRLLVDARKTAGITQIELSIKLSRPQSYVSKYERGERRLDVVEFLAVVRALRGDPHFFIRNIQRRPTVSRKSPKGTK